MERDQGDQDLQDDKPSQAEGDVGDDALTASEEQGLADSN